MADRSDVAVALALASTAGRELLVAIAESPRARRAAETFAASLLLATSAAEVEQSGPVVRIGKAADK
ncbi:MAG: hypothetical protein IT375_18065 [Polyangiaceae bacterium]|nr:hypothetical protein [Polyangiaceae bacterium]